MGQVADTKVSVIIVAFNSLRTLEACLRSIPHSAEVVVVDQESRDGSAQFVRQVRPSATLIRAGANRGFAAGCNLGAANAKGDVLLFLNPDAFLGPDCLSILVESALSANALVGPKILDPDGREKTWARNHSNMLMDIFEEILPRKFTVGLLARNIPEDDEVYRVGGTVPYVQGSCMALSAENFWRAGGFDERFFLYYEEESLAKSLAKIGVRVKLEPKAVVTHIGSVSTSQSSNFAVTQLYRSRTLYYKLYHRQSATLLFSCILWSLLSMMGITSSVRRLIGVRPSRDRVWYRSASAGVASGWKGRVVEPPGARWNTSKIAD
ncbi:predicted glycosyltransferase [Mycolicibacterium gilvum Spyr1]|uniref:Predicted glycosyltransferase n=2 Tax=Mycolicibacterium gilvum TaxID=1804 RepID=E6TAR4_MYCSR|nr:predicted glycosyltransferase [Mycolicibacterium gilvum Spyr1]